VKANDQLKNLSEEISGLSKPDFRIKTNIRGLCDTTFLAAWSAYHPNKTPDYSRDFRDEEEGEELVKIPESLWTEASQYLEALCPSQYKELCRCRLPKGINKLTEVWCGFAVNCGSETEPVQTEPHTDYKSVFWAKSCLYSFGDFEDKGMVLWKLKTILILKPRDLFIFEDHLITHSNESAKGIRHSLIAFTHQHVLDWHNTVSRRVEKPKDKRVRQQRKNYTAERLNMTKKVIKTKNKLKKTTNGSRNCT
jgi:hypothetical protein